VRSTVSPPKPIDSGVRCSRESHDDVRLTLGGALRV
jgi:hypothetical protein